ncbi:MAG: reductase [Pseudonocardiales bacterium]|nr:MAG: reductase [Pseudonocardiales bacterium]
MRAFVLGGSGLVGRAVSRRLLSAGWDVDIVGRDAARLPVDLVEQGVGFTAADRSDTSAVGAAFGGGADLLVDCVCYTAKHALDLVALADAADSTVMISSKAVYADAAGRHSNSAEPPRFDGPVPESQLTVAPGDMDFNSGQGYGPNKVAAEHVLLDSGLPVTVLRPSKIHGEGARPARTWVFVKRVLDRRPVVLHAHGGRGVDHPSAAVNIAALVETVAARPGRRILNIADRDAPSGAEIARVVAHHLDHQWDEILLGDDAGSPLGWHPWDRRHPVVLDTAAALGLGYSPVGDFASTAPAEIDWLVSLTGIDGGARLPAAHDWSVEGAFGRAFDYAAEDGFLAGRRQPGPTPSGRATPHRPR